MEENLDNPPNKMGSRTQNSVQPSQSTKRKPSQQRTAAVNTAGHKCVDKGESGLVGERSGNHPKLTVALTCNQIYMVRKASSESSMAPRSSTQVEKVL